MKNLTWISRDGETRQRSLLHVAAKYGQVNEGTCTMYIVQLYLTLHNVHVDSNANTCDVCVCVIDRERNSPNAPAIRLLVRS